MTCSKTFLQASQRTGRERRQPLAGGHPQGNRGCEVASVARLIVPLNRTARIADLGPRYHESGATPRAQRTSGADYLLLLGAPALAPIHLVHAAVLILDEDILTRLFASLRPTQRQRWLCGWRQSSRMRSRPAYRARHPFRWRVQRDRGSPIEYTSSLQHRPAFATSWRHLETREEEANPRKEVSL
jgi:hypothetical protein